MEQLEPTIGKAVVDILPDARTTASGIIIAETVKEIPHRAILRSIGKPVTDKKNRQTVLNIPINSIIHFKRQWSKPIKETQTIIIKQDDIIAFERDYEHNQTPQALRDEVIIKRIYTNSIDHSTLFIPDVAGSRSNLEDYYGEVLSVGAKDKLGVQVGMKIFYHRNEGIRINIPFDRNEYFVLKPRAILAELV